MASFDLAYKKVLDAEGGYQKHPNDRGNYNSLGALVGTNWGISAPVYETWIHRPPTETDMRNMPLSTAKNIYRVRFWDRIQGNQIRNQNLADFIFDGAVNHGVSTGVRLLQKALRIREDGVLGNQTLFAINAANPAALYNRYKEERIRFYHKIAERPGQSVFLTGWLNRMKKFDAYPKSGSPLLFLVLAGVAGWVWLKYKGHADKLKLVG